MTKSFDYSQFLLIRSEQDWVHYKLTFTQGVESSITGPLFWAVPEKYPCLCASFLLEEAVRSDTGDVQVNDVVVTSFCYMEDAELLADAIKSTNSKVTADVSIMPPAEYPANPEPTPDTTSNRLDPASTLAIATALELEALGAIKPQQLKKRYGDVTNYCQVNGTDEGIVELFQSILSAGEKGTE
jgi:hypothetical protein